MPAGAPDVVAVEVERDDDAITFRVRFTAEPPLGLSEQEGWVDMLLIGIDVPPFGPPPEAPGGEWRGTDYALGTHGPSPTGILVRLRRPGEDSGDAGTSVTRDEIPLETDGTTLSLSVPRAALGDPDSFALSVAAAREWSEATDEPEGATPDIAPDTGTWTVNFE